MNANFNMGQETRQYEKYKNMEDTIQINTKTIRMLLQEKEQLTETVANLKKEIAKKNEEAQRKPNLEVNKYKSLPEFVTLLNLNKDLLDFQGKIKSIIDKTCNAMQTNKHDDEIEKIKLGNAELYAKLKHSNVRSVIVEKSVELKDAEKELSIKKEGIQQEFLKINGRLIRIKEDMGQATTKFAATVEKSILELQKNLQKYQKEVSDIEQNSLKINDSLMYEKIKNILLQQENALMKEMLASNAGPSTLNTNVNPPSPKVLNNQAPSPNYIKNANANKTNPLFANTSNFQQFKKKSASKENLTNFNSSSDDSDDENFSVVDDEETTPVCGTPKPFKLIMLNVHEGGNKSDEQKVQLVLKELTKLSLDDIQVRRIGKPSAKPQGAGKPRTIIVAFTSQKYLDEILKNKHQLKNTKYSMIKLHPYKAKSGDPKKGQKPQGPKKPNPNKGNSNQGKSGKSAKNVFPF